MQTQHPVNVVHEDRPIPVSLLISPHTAWAFNFANKLQLDAKNMPLGVVMMWRRNIMCHWQCYEGPVSPVSPRFSFPPPHSPSPFSSLPFVCLPLNLLWPIPSHFHPFNRGSRGIAFRKSFEITHRWVLISAFIVKKMEKIHLIVVHHVCTTVSFSHLQQIK
jgi:hypothetical protein